MREINCERKAGHLSVWFCAFSTKEEYQRYFDFVFCVDNEADYDPRYNLHGRDYQQLLADRFLPENQQRPFEAVLRERFTEGCFCPFIYDFGVSFDPDFQVGGYCEEKTRNIATVLGEWADDYLVDPIKALVGEELPRAYNGFFAISSCIYNGYTKGVSWGNCRVDFAGVAEEDTYSDELSAEYNG